MRSSWLSTVSLFLLACGPGSVASEQGDTRDDATAQTATQATDSTNATHVETSPETTEADTTPPTTSEEETITFVPGDCSGGGNLDDEVGVRCSPPLEDCDPYAQDCPEGEKCVPYASTGGPLDSTKCVSIQGDVPVGGPCTANNFTEATDDCDGDGWCLSLGGGPGYCRGFCQGTANAPVCAEGTTCSGEASSNEVVLCLPDCETSDACEPGEACYLWRLAPPLSCMPEGASGLGEACSEVNACAAGLLCASASFVPGCQDLACCAPLCSLADGQACAALPGTECAAMFEAPVDPPWDDFGVCVDPMAMP